MDWDYIRSQKGFFVKRKFFGLGTSMIYDAAGSRLLLYAKAKFRGGMGFRIFSSAEMTEELIFAKREFGGKDDSSVAKGMGSFKKAINSTYSVTDSKTGELIGGFRRRGLRSILRDTWLILSPDGREIGQIAERSGLGAFLSRMIALVPQKYTIEINGTAAAELNGRVSFFVPKFDLKVVDQNADIRMVMTAAALIGGVEGKQGQGS
ncbi:MAG: hypothetical protein JXA20_20575 [Spirochaetes bacterium]|nr:hypothetical protein [Spirochaetota bacterium]